MHGFQLSVIVDDIVTDWHSEAGVRCYSMRWQQKSTDNFNRQKNVLSKSCKNQYNAYNKNKMRKECINKYKQLVKTSTKHILRYLMELTIEQALQQGVAAHKEDKLQEAERLYRAILQSQPLHPDANHNLGLIAVSVNQDEAALPLFKTALEANR